MKHFTISYLGMILFFMSTSFNHKLYSQDTEPNNSIATASVLAPNASVTGDLFMIPANDAADFYSVDIIGNGNLTYTVDLPSGLNARLFLYRPNGSFITSSANLTGPAQVSLTASCVDAGQYYVLLQRNSGAGTYTLSNSYTAPPRPNDVEPNGTIALTSEFLAPDETVTGHLRYSGSEAIDAGDFYGLIAGDDGNVTVSTAIDPTLNARLFLYYKNGALINSSTNGTDALSVMATCLANDTIYALIQGNSGCGSYEFTFTTDTPPTHDQDVEPNNSIATSNIFLEPNESVEGRLGYVGVNISDTGDFFGLVADDDGDVTVSLTFAPIINARLFLYFKNGSLITSSSNGTDALSLTANCLAQDTVYVLVQRNSGCGSYELQYAVESPELNNDTEPNNLIAEATSIGTGHKNQGHLGYNKIGEGIDVYDYYSFEVVEAPFEMEARAELGGTLNGRLFLYNPAGAFLTSSINFSGELSLLYTINDPGTYTLLIQRNSGCGSYQLGDICAQYPTVTATPDSPLDKCTDEIIDFTASNGLAAYEWLINGIPVSEGQSYASDSPGTYQVVGYDINACPDTTAVVLVSNWNCNDNDPCTDDSCTPGVGCVNTFSGDDDNDGTCNNLDLCPNDPNKIAPGDCGCGNPEPGATCDDNDPSTIDDMITVECECVGTPSPCAGDITGDLLVNISDFIALNSAYGTSCSGCPADLNNSGTVNVDDFIILNTNYGSDCTTLIPSLASGSGLNAGLRQDLNRIDDTQINSDLAKRIDELTAVLGFDIFPNPNSGLQFEVRLNTGASSAQSVTIELLDIRGKRVMYEDVSLKKGSSIIPIETGQILDSGIYLVKLVVGSAVCTKRMSVR